MGTRGEGREFILSRHLDSDLLAPCLGISKAAEGFCLGYQLFKTCYTAAWVVDPFLAQASHVRSRSLNALDKAERHRVDPDLEYDRSRDSKLLGRYARRDWSDPDDIRPLSHEIEYYLRVALILAFGAPKLECDVLVRH